MKRTRWAALALVSLAFAAGLVLPASPPVASATLVAAPVFTAPVQAAGMIETWTVSGWYGTSAKQMSSATVVFPDGFVLPAQPIVSVIADGRLCQTGSTTSVGLTISVNITGACWTFSAASKPWITVDGVKNPSVAGTKPAAGFKLSTSIDGEATAASDVVIWGLTAQPTTCRVTATGSVAEARFTTTNRIPAANTGQIRPLVLNATTTYGSFVESPFENGPLSAPTTSAAGMTTSFGGVAASIPASAALTASVAGPGVTGVAIVTISITSMTGGFEFVPLASAEIRFNSGQCVPPLTPLPATQGVFAGGTIAASGVSIVSFTGTTAQLSTAGAASKVVSVTAAVGGKSITFVVGAPDFANAEFNTSFPTGLSGTLVIVKV